MLSPVSLVICHQCNVSPVSCHLYHLRHVCSCHLYHRCAHGVLLSLLSPVSCVTCVTCRLCHQCHVSPVAPVSCVTCGTCVMCHLCHVACVTIVVSPVSPVAPVSPVSRMPVFQVENKFAALRQGQSEEEEEEQPEAKVGRWASASLMRSCCLTLRVRLTLLIKLPQFHLDSRCLSTVFTSLRFLSRRTRRL